MNAEQKEARRLLGAVDCLAGRLDDSDKKFVISLINKWKGDFTPGQIKRIELIAELHDIL